MIYKSSLGKMFQRLGLLVFSGLFVLQAKAVGPQVHLMEPGTAAGDRAIDQTVRRFELNRVIVAAQASGLSDRLVFEVAITEGSSLPFFSIRRGYPDQTQIENILHIPVGMDAVALQELIRLAGFNRNIVEMGYEEVLCPLSGSDRGRILGCSTAMQNFLNIAPCLRQSILRQLRDSLGAAVTSRPDVNEFFRNTVRRISFTGRESDYYEACTGENAQLMIHLPRESKRN